MSEPAASASSARSTTTRSGARAASSAVHALDRRGARIDWMDLLRGLAILLVILHHSTQIVSARIDEVPESLTFLSNFFAPFRMPTLMFLSGLLVATSLKRPAGTYIWGKVRRIGWPILVWTIIYVTASGGSDFAWYEPSFWATYLWFLQFIAAYYLIALLTRWVPVWAFVVLPFIGMFLLPMDSLEQRFLYLMPFFFLGALIERYWAQYAGILSTRWAAVLAIVPIAVAVYSGVVTPLWYHPLAAVPAMVGILILVRLASVIPEVGWLRPIRFIGKYSLIFYCVHYPVFAGLGRLAERAGVTDPLVGLVGIFTLTLLVCFGFAYVGRRLPFSLLFELPRRRSGTS
ncbi:MAG: acyltransferase [Homoserinimonas sp.]